MSVRLHVSRTGAGELRLPLAGQETADTILVPLAKELHLKLAAELNTFYRVNRDNVHQLASELGVLLAKVKADHPNSVTLAENIARVIAELEQLANETEWTAEFG